MLLNDYLVTSGFQWQPSPWMLRQTLTMIRTIHVPETYQRGGLFEWCYKHQEAWF